MYRKLSSPMLTDTINRYEVGLQCVFKNIKTLTYTSTIHNITYKGSLKRSVQYFKLTFLPVQHLIF